MDKIKIQKNTVQETLIIPLYARKLCTERFPELFRDDGAAALMERLDYDFSKVAEQSKSTMHVFGALEVGMRQNDLAWEVREYLKEYPRAAVVNLGCGLDRTGRICDNGTCKIYNLDFPEVIEMRNLLLPAGEREMNLATDLNDFSWFDKIDAEEGAIFFAAGVFYYFQREDAKRLITAMAGRFSGGRLVFDSCGKTGVKMMLKTWIKQAEIKDVGAYFYINDVAELKDWKNVRATSRGYMLGYFSFDGVKKVTWLHRMLSKIGDGPIGMKIVRLDFVREPFSVTG